MGSGMLGSPTRPLERGSSSESLSLGSVNHPRRWAVVVLGLASKDGARVRWLAKPVLRLSWSFRERPSQSFVYRTLLLVLTMPLFKAEDVE